MGGVYFEKKNFGKKIFFGSDFLLAKGFWGYHYITMYFDTIKELFDI